MGDVPTVFGPGHAVAIAFGIGVVLIANSGPLRGRSGSPIAGSGSVRSEHRRNPQSEPGVAAPDGPIAVDVKGRQRRAIVVNRGTAEQRRPAVIVLHGGQGNADAMRRRTGFDALARKEGFVVVYAEGTRFGAEGLDQYAWNTGYLLRRQVRDSDDIAYFDTLIDLLIRDHGADPKRIFMTGGSNGGMMTYVYAVARPGKLAAVAPIVASMFTFDTTPAVPLPILIINGERDEEVPIGGGFSNNPIVRRAQAVPFKAVDDVVRYWVKANRAETKPTYTTKGSVTTTVYAARKDGAPVEFVRDADGGHGWPGTRSRRSGARPIDAFSGAERVWEFFKHQARNP
ncbi:MAG: alpha/beta hydrolase family esterase [Armatimonadota bacterium]